MEEGKYRYMHGAVVGQRSCSAHYRIYDELVAPLGDISRTRAIKIRAAYFKN